MKRRKPVPEAPRKLTKEEKAAQKKHLRSLELLRRVFRADRADLIRMARPHRHKESKCTKKGHQHKSGLPGAKLSKRHAGRP